MIKNSHIIHRLFLDIDDDKFKYYCNRACGYKPEKSTYQDNEVTCKNCLRQITRSKR